MNEIEILGEIKAEYQRARYNAGPADGKTRTECDKHINAIESARAAIREKLEREKNEPLTLDELKMMIGEPVFIVTSGLKEWCIVHSYHRPEVIGRSFIMTRRTAEKRLYAFDDYGKTWTAYSHPPAENKP